MPFVQRAVAPVHLSRVKLHDDQGAPTVRDRELDAVTNCALSNALRQMASVAALADEMFRELRNQLTDVATRSAGLKCRVQALGHLVDNADPKAVTVRELSHYYTVITIVIILKPSCYFYTILPELDHLFTYPKFPNPISSEEFFDTHPLRLSGISSIIPSPKAFSM